ncbi:hypothetical protein Tco_1188867 [Tanacetum coccineum]
MRTDIDLFKLAAVQLSSQRELKRKLKKGLQESLSRRELLQQVNSQKVKRLAKGVHGVHDEKRVWFEVELQGAQGDHKAEVFQVSNDDTAVAQRRLKDKQYEEKTNMDYLVKDEKKEYQTGWKIKTVIQQQNGLVKETNVTLLAKVRCFLIQSRLSKVFRAEDTAMSTYLVNRSPSSAIGFKTPVDMLGFFGWLAIKQEMLEPVKVKCIFLGYRKGTGSMQVLHEFEFKGATLSMGTIQYREDNNEAAFAVAVVDMIYAHESLTFNDTVACEVISKWKARLKDDMDSRSDLYVLSNGCKKCSDDSDGYYWESTPRFGLPRVCWLKQREIYLVWRSSGIRVSIRDCDLEKNGKWSCRYAVRSHEYQMVCMRLDIASTDVGMLDKFYHGLQTSVQVFVDFDYAMAAYMTLTGTWKKEIWLKGLLAESGYELSLVAGIETGTLVKGGSRSEVPAQVKGAAYRY